jgi:cytidylate kinase
MGQVLMHYMSQRLNEVSFKASKKEAGPVITISRAGGCASYKISKILESKLNEILKQDLWQVISKEILHHSAEKLKLHPERINQLSKKKERTIMDDILHAFLSSDYQLEKKVEKTLINVISRFGYEGHKIILGRGGNLICCEIQKSLHIRIDAPMHWKIEQVIEKKGFTKDEAIKYIEETETNRRLFRQSIKGSKEQCDNFDLMVNQSKFSDEEIVNLIVAASRMKGILPDQF